MFMSLNQKMGKNKVELKIPEGELIPLNELQESEETKTEEEQDKKEA